MLQVHPALMQRRLSLSHLSERMLHLCSRHLEGRLSRSDHGRLGLLLSVCCVHLGHRLLINRNRLVFLTLCNDGAFVKGFLTGQVALRIFHGHTRLFPLRLHRIQCCTGVLELCLGPLHCSTLRRHIGLRHGKLRLCLPHARLKVFWVNPGDNLALANL